MSTAAPCRPFLNVADRPSRFFPTRSRIKRRAIGIARPIFPRRGKYAARAGASEEQPQRLQLFQSAKTVAEMFGLFSQGIPSQPEPREILGKSPGLRTRVWRAKCRCPRCAAESARRIGARAQNSAAPNRCRPRCENRSARARSETRGARVIPAPSRRWPPRAKRRVDVRSLVSSVAASTAGFSGRRLFRCRARRAFQSARILGKSVSSARKNSRARRCARVSGLP